MTKPAIDLPGEVPTREGYDRWAATYDGDGNPLIAVEEPIFDRLVGEVRGLDVIDVGCGTGRHALRLAARGARVSAVDFSSAMLAKARAKPGAEAIAFIEHDIRERLAIDDASFDLVVCALVLDHIHDLERFFTELGRLCRPGGAIVATVMHPAMMLKGVQARFIDEQTGRRVSLESAPNTIADYVNAIVSVGLQIDRLEEHVVDETVVSRLPRGKPYLGWPICLAMRLRPEGEA